MTAFSRHFFFYNLCTLQFLFFLLVSFFLTFNYLLSRLPSYCTICTVHILNLSLHRPYAKYIPLKHPISTYLLSPFLLFILPSISIHPLPCLISNPRRTSQLPSLLTISPSHSVTSSLLLYPSLLRFSLIFFFTPIFFYIYLYQISIPHFQSIPISHLLPILTPLIQLPSLFLFIISTA